MDIMEKEEINIESISSRLLIARKRKQYTQLQMAKAIDIADRTYKFYELGHREIPISTAIKFCEICDVEIEWLILGISYLKNKKLSLDINITLSNDQNILLSFDNNITLVSDRSIKLSLV